MVKGTLKDMAVSFDFEQRIDWIAREQNEKRDRGFYKARAENTYCDEID